MNKQFRWLFGFIFLFLPVGSMALGQPAFVKFFGPMEFVRGTGAPVTEAKEFSAFGFLPPFSLHLRNGDEDGNNRVSSAEVWLNDNPLFTESAFSQQVAGLDVAVSLNNLNTLEVRLKSAPGSKLTIWIEGQPPVLNITRNEAHRVSALVTSSGGTLSTFSADGTELVLTIPEGALFEEQQVSLTPIAALSGLPLSGGLLRGVDLAPSGLLLIKPAILEIKSPTPLVAVNYLIGFAYDGNGQNFHLYPFQANQTNAVFRLGHFSGYGLAGGTAAETEAAAWAASTSDVQTWAESEIALIMVISGGNLSPADIEKIIEIMTVWFEKGVLPALGEAIECAAQASCDSFNLLFDYAISEFCKWLATAQMLGIENDPRIKLLEENFGSLLYAEFKDIIQDYSELCSESVDFCGEKLSLSRRIMRLYGAYQFYGIDEPLPVDIENICGGFAGQVVSKVDIVTPAPTIGVDETIKLGFEISSGWGPIESLTEGEITWESSDTTKASVDRDTGVVTGIAEGSADIRIVLTQCDKKFIDEVAVTVVKPAVARWKVTWRTENHYDRSSSQTTYGSDDTCSWGTWTSHQIYDGVFQGEAVVETTETGPGGSGSSKVVSLTASGNRELQSSLLVNCTYCGNDETQRTWSYKYDDSWSVTDQSIGWLKLNLSITRGTDPSYIRINLGGNIPGYFDVYHTESIGLTCSGFVNQIVDGPREGAVWYRAPAEIPASDGTGKKYYLKTETWEVSIEKVN